MKQTIFLLLVFFMALSQVSAQTNDRYTLQQCIDYALQNEGNVKNAILDKEIADAKIRETKAIGYPNISAGASLVDNPALQRMFFSPTNPFLAGGAPSGGGGNMFPGVKQSGDVLVAPNLFQLRSAGDANAQLTQLIFDGSYVVALQAASSYRELGEKGLKQTKIQTVENVTKAYYAVLIAEENAKMFDINLIRLDSTLNELRAYYKTGLVEDIDVKRMEVQYNNLLTDKQNTENLLQLGNLALKLSMGMPLEQTLLLADSIRSLEMDVTPIEAQQFDVTKRVEYSLLQTQERLAILDLKRYRFSRLPTLSAFAKGGYIRQDGKFFNLVQNEWFGYGMFGLNLSIPILDFKRHYQIQQAKYATQKAKNSMTLAENAFKLEASSSRLNYNNSIKAMQNQKRNMELAEEVLRVSKIKYKEGLGSGLEVTNAEADLQTAQINYYRALYEAMVTKINHQKATGALYNE